MTQSNPNGPNQYEQVKWVFKEGIPFEEVTGRVAYLRNPEGFFKGDKAKIEKFWQYKKANVNHKQLLQEIGAVNGQGAQQKKRKAHDLQNGGDSSDEIGALVNKADEKFAEGV